MLQTQEVNCLPAIDLLLDSGKADNGTQLNKRTAQALYEQNERVLLCEVVHRSCIGRRRAAKGLPWIDFERLVNALDDGEEDVEIVDSVEDPGAVLPLESRLAQWLATKDEATKQNPQSIPHEEFSSSISAMKSSREWRKRSYQSIHIVIPP